MPKSSSPVKKTGKTISEPLSTEPTPSFSSNKGLACLVIGCVSVILLSMLAAAGIAVFVVLKVKSDPAFLSKFLIVPGVTTILPVSPTPPPSVSSNIDTKREALATVFLYPGSTVDRMDDTPDGYQVNLLMKTTDSPEAIRAYYDQLISLNSWATRPVETSIGGIEYMDIVQPDFNTQISIERDVVHNMVDVYAGIAYEDDELYSSVRVPSGSMRIPASKPAVSTATAPEYTGIIYMLPFSSTERVTREDLIGLTPWDLKVSRNEIYARHGRPFVSKDMSCYFNSQPWYRIDPSYTDARLSKLELENAVFILNYEKSTGSTIYDKDTGCVR